MSIGPALFFARRILGLGKGRALRAKGETAPGSRYLRGAVVGIALSIVPLVVVLIVADGMIEGITARYIEVGTYHLQARPLVPMDETGLAARARAIRALSTVASAFPEYQGYGVALAGDRTAGVAIRAVDPAFLADPGTAAYLKVNAGQARLDSSNQILLGEALARNLGVKVGDVVSIVTTRPVSFGANSSAFSPKVSAFIVRGIVSAGYRELDALWAFVSLKSGSRIFSQGSARSFIGIKIAKPYGDLEAARSQLTSSLGEDWSIVTWPEAERNVYKSFSTTRALLLLVMALAVAVAAINVSSALVMLVLERRRDIAILKSSGSSPGFIARVFILAGLGLGAAGTAIGLTLGSAISWKINDILGLVERLINASSRFWAVLTGNAVPRTAIRILDPAYYLERIPVNIKPVELALVAGASLALCLIASLVPARQASRLPPLEIFRKT
jgi:lipoprotein-releasing system permease protein